MPTVRRRVALALMLPLAGCASAEPERAMTCPRVAAVAGLDRLDYHYPGVAPVRARLDVVDGICTYDGDGFTVRSTVAIRLDPNRPRGEFQIPYAIAIDTAAGTSLDRADYAVIPAGADGIVETFEHRVEGVGEFEGDRVRILYALTPDDTELTRIARERPRPPS